MTYYLQSMIDAISLGSLYALVAISIGLVFGIMRLVNFVQAEYITIGAYSLVVPSAALVPALFLGALPWPVAIIAVLAVSTVLAVLTERFSFRPMRGADQTTLLVASFSLGYMLQNVILLVHTGRPKPIGFGAELTTAIGFMGLWVPTIQIVTFLVCVVALLLLVVLLRFTRIGIQMRAAAEDFEMARVLGVNADRVIMLSFAISGVLGGITALLFVVQIGSLDYRMGLLPVIFGFFAAVVGGLGSLAGAALGGFLLGAGSQLLQAYLPDGLKPFRDAFLFTAVIMVLLVRPHGLITPSTMKERV